MNYVVLLPADFVSDTRAKLTGRRLTHLLEVLKAAPGKVCKAGMLDGKLGEAEIVAVSQTAAEVEFRPLTEPPPKLPLTLVMALPRPKTLKKVLMAAVSQGVAKIYFVGTFKVEKSYWSSPLLSPENLFEEQLLALEQCGDTKPIEIEFHRFFKPFAEDVLPQLAAGKTLLLAHPGSMTACPAHLTGFAVLLLGPEGGFTDYEVALAETAGAQKVHLGPRILRTEVALSALIGHLY